MDLDGCHPRDGGARGNRRGNQTQASSSLAQATPHGT